MRATTACNKLLAIPGADVAGVRFDPRGIVVVQVPPRSPAALPVWLVDPGGL